MQIEFLPSRESEREIRRAHPIPESRSSTSRSHYLHTNYCSPVQPHPSIMFRNTYPPSVHSSRIDPLTHDCTQLSMSLLVHQLLLNALTRTRFEAGLGQRALQDDQERV